MKLTKGNLNQMNNKGKSVKHQKKKKTFRRKKGGTMRTKTVKKRNKKKNDDVYFGGRYTIDDVFKEYPDLKEKYDSLPLGRRSTVNLNMADYDRFHDYSVDQIADLLRNYINEQNANPIPDAPPFETMNSTNETIKTQTNNKTFTPPVTGEPISPVTGEPISPVIAVHIPYETGEPISSVIAERVINVDKPINNNNDDVNLLKAVKPLVKYIVEKVESKMNIGSPNQLTNAAATAETIAAANQLADPFSTTVNKSSSSSNNNNLSTVNSSSSNNNLSTNQQQTQNNDQEQNNYQEQINSLRQSILNIINPNSSNNSQNNNEDQQGDIFSIKQAIAKLTKLLNKKKQ